MAGEERKKNLLSKVVNAKLLKKVSLDKQRAQLVRIGKDRYQWLKNFAEGNLMESRKLAKTRHPQSKDELSAYNRARLENAYRHPFDKIPEEYFKNSDY